MSCLLIIFTIALIVIIALILFGLFFVIIDIFAVIGAIAYVIRIAEDEGDFWENLLVLLGCILILII